MASPLDGATLKKTRLQHWLRIDPEQTGRTDAAALHDHAIAGTSAC